MFVLWAAQDQQGEHDGVDRGLRTGPEHVTLEKIQLASSEASDVVSSSFNLLKVEVCETLWRIPLL